MGQARRFADQRALAGLKAQAFEKPERANEWRMMSPEVLQQAMAAIQAKNLPEASRRRVEDAVRDLYFSTLDEHNARASG